MIVKTSTMNVSGHKVVQFTRNCVRKSLTEEVQDVAFETVEDFLHGVNIEDAVSLSRGQSTLVDCLKYYVSDTVDQFSINCHVIGDGRNNEIGDFGKKFEVEIAFTVVNSLVPTKITYNIEYKQ